MSHILKTAAVLLSIASLGLGVSRKHFAPLTLPSPTRIGSRRSISSKPVIWGSTCEGPGRNRPLVRRRTSRDADDGLPQPRGCGVGGQWIDLREALAGDSRQRTRDRIWELREQQKDVVAHARWLYFSGNGKEQLADSHVLAKLIQDENRLAGAASALCGELDRAAAAGDDLAEAWTKALPLSGAKERLERIARTSADHGVTPDLLTEMRAIQVSLEQSADALAAEPPAREVLSPIVYEPKTKLFVLFGGDHCDYLTNDTWVFDPAHRRWTLRHIQPRSAAASESHLEVHGRRPAPCSAAATSYFSNTDYMGGQFIDLADGDWTYDVAEDNRTGRGKAGAYALSRTYRTGLFLPEFFFDASVPTPDAAAIPSSACGFAGQRLDSRQSAAPTAGEPRLGHGRARSEPRSDSPLVGRPLCPWRQRCASVPPGDQSLGTLLSRRIPTGAALRQHGISTWFQFQSPPLDQRPHLSKLRRRPGAEKDDLSRPSSLRLHLRS